MLYTALVNEKFNNEHKADLFIDKIIEARKKLDENKLTREKFTLIKEIKDTYPIDEFFQSRVYKYKELASVYKLFKSLDESEDYNPADVIRSRYTLVEHITGEEASSQQLIKESENSDEVPTIEETRDLRLLAQQLMTKRFNEKYGVLLSEQKTLLRKYINNISNTNSLRGYVNEEVDTLKASLEKLSKKVDDKVLKIKLSEAVSLMEQLKKGKLVSDDQITSLMMYYKLKNDIQSTLRK